MSVIFNEPGGGQTLSNPSQQNNVFQFVQTTKPTQRAVGVSLVAGDRWYNTSNGTEWFWNGTYWLSPEINIESSTTWVGAQGNGGVGFSLPLKQSPSNTVFVKTIIGNININAANNGSNYYVFTFSVSFPGAAIGSLNTSSLNVALPTRVSVKSDLNIAVSITDLSGILGIMTIVGSPGAYDFLAIGVVYHLIA